MFRPCLKFFRHSNASHCVLSRKFSPSQVKNAKEFPERLPTIRETAQRLGFVDEFEMYPNYALQEPCKLWLVSQTKRLKYRPFWEKETMKDMGLYKVHDISIQMNTPETNEKLWQVKHLLKISPIRFPNGEPEEKDIGSTKLKGNGELQIYTKMNRQETSEELIPMLDQKKWKVVIGYRMCNNCKHRRCYKFQMCQKLWLQRGRNHLERIAPKLYKYVDMYTPDKSSTDDCPMVSGDATNS